MSVSVPTAALPAPPQRRSNAGASARRNGRLSRYGLRTVALGYLALLVLLPLVALLYRTFEHGLAPVWDAVTAPYAVHAFWLSLELVAIVVPLNTVFGIGIAILLERHSFRGRALVGALIDVPFAISPVVIGLSLLLVYGDEGWFGNWLTSHGIQIIFSVPGMVLATAFVCLPFVARETMPVLRELGTEAEQAASTLGASSWQTFWRITLPGIRWAVVYGVVLTTARALGEFGAVSIVSGNVLGVTQTLPLYVKNEFDNFDVTGAYAASVVLLVMTLITLLLMQLLTRKARRPD
jgi:sulfate transport system permease protein